MPRYQDEEITHNIKPDAGCADRKYRGEIIVLLIFPYNIILNSVNK